MWLNKVMWLSILHQPSADTNSNLLVQVRLAYFSNTGAETLIASLEPSVYKCSIELQNGNTEESLPTEKNNASENEKTNNDLSIHLIFILYFFYI